MLPPSPFAVGIVTIINRMSLGFELVALHSADGPAEARSDGAVESGMPQRSGGGLVGCETLEVPSGLARPEQEEEGEGDEGAEDLAREHGGIDEAEPQ